jgi:hypothetical protein
VRSSLASVMEKKPLLVKAWLGHLQLLERILKMPSSILASFMLGCHSVVNCFCNLSNIRSSGRNFLDSSLFLFQMIRIKLLWPRSGKFNIYLWFVSL